MPRINSPAEKRCQSVGHSSSVTALLLFFSQCVHSFHQIRWRVVWHRQPGIRVVKGPFTEWAVQFQHLGSFAVLPDSVKVALFYCRQFAAEHPRSGHECRCDQVISGPETDRRHVESQNAKDGIVCKVRDRGRICGNKQKLQGKARSQYPWLYAGRLDCAPDVLLFESDRTGMRVRPVRTERRFAKYRGIGNRGIGFGKKAINRWLREMRGR